jgi:ParB family chromosome partitioning protein
LLLSNLLQRTFAASNLLIGIIDEVDIHKIRHPSIMFYGGERIASSELIDSIRQNGLLHPIVVRTKGSLFEIIAGCRRYSACRALGLRKIICHVVELDDKSAFEISLTENIQRRSLDPIEEAKAFKAYVDDFGWGGLTELASKISKSPAYVCKRVALLKLPDEMLEKVRNCDVSPSTAEELIPLKDVRQQHRIADVVIIGGYSSREARKLVKMSLDEKYETEGFPIQQDSLADIELHAQRSFDKSIIALKIAMNKISGVVESVEGNWIVYEILMQHKNMLNAQIDVLIREKKKLR